MRVISRRTPSHPSLPETEGAERLKGLKRGQGAGLDRGKSGVRG